MKKHARLLIPLIAVFLALGFLQFKQRYIDYKPVPAIPQQISLPDKIEQVIDSVVHVVNKTQGWQGSGVIVTPNIILTARHVAEGGNDFVITLIDKTQIKAVRAISSKKYDLGFIKTEKPIFKLARLGSVKNCRTGEQVFAIGSPFGKLNFNSVTLGIISGLNRNCDFDDWYGNDYGWHVVFQTDAAGHPGNSGCPVFNMNNEVIGILVGGFSPVLIYCVPVDLIVRDLPLISALFAMDNYYLEERKEQNWNGYVQEFE